MTITYILLLLFTCVIAITANFFRYRVSMLMNKWILVISSLLLVEVYALLISFEQKGLIVFFIFMAAYCFQNKGGLVAALFGWGIHTIQTGQINVFFLLGYIFIGISIGTFEKHRQKTVINQTHWHAITIRNAKQLNVFREVSMSMQETRELERILKIITTSVTAGHGLGFNRAMILLADEEQVKLHGVIGVGPMNAADGYKIWENITKNKYNLNDLIEIQGVDLSLDSKLNQYVRALEIDLDHHSFLTQALASGEPLHIKEINTTDEEQLLFSDAFNMEEFVAFPLINRGIKVGILIIDNPVNKKVITPEEIDSVIPIANQAAIAIQQARLYGKIEDMALKDGLTGLRNQRSFQLTLESLFSSDHDRSLSCIMMDIDFFKHYNDTNGHLLGNDVLVQLATVMNDSIRDVDHSFRFGGEEFVVLLPNTGIDKAFIIAERLRVNVENTAFPNRESQPGGLLTISLGVASTGLLPENTPSHLIDAADNALYQAKDLGRNRVESYKELITHG